MSDPASGPDDLNLPAHRRPGRWPVAFMALLILGGLAGLAYGVVRPRVLARASATNAASRSGLAEPTVNVVRLTRADPQSELVLPGTIRAFQEASLYARTNGYLSRWLVDLGAQVKTGELLAEIDTPEIDQEKSESEAALVSARAEVALAEADVKLAEATARRAQSLRQRGAISEQDYDQTQAGLDANVAKVAAARARVLAGEARLRRLDNLQSFQQVLAPFDGVVTARNVDVGALITAGSGSNTTELFRLSKADELRVFVNVPQAYVAAVRIGQQANLLVREFTKRTFEGKVVRNAGSIDPASRTLLTEVRVSNRDGALLPGMYVQVRFRVTLPEPPVLVPANALLIKVDGPQVAVVADDATLHYRKIELGRDYGPNVEALAGLDGRERVVVNLGDDLPEGVRVRARLQEPEKAKAP